MTENWVLLDAAAGAGSCVSVCDDAGAWERIVPDMIYNRLDRIREEPSLLLRVEDAGGALLVPCCVVGNTAILGVWGTRLTMAQAQAVARYVFAQYPEVVAVSSRRADLVDAPAAFQRVNDFFIELPQTAADVDARLSAKTRATMRRKMRQAQASLGAATVADVGVAAPEAPALFDWYFAKKRVTHHREYGMTMEEYLRAYYVTDIYVLRFGGRIASVVLLCEQGSAVYLENLTYDVALARFSPGGLLYHACLHRLAEKGKRSFYLKGGTQAYKRHYGSVERWLSTFKIYRSAEVVGLDTF